MRVVIGEGLFLLREGLVKLLSAHGFEVVAAGGTVPDPEVVRKLPGRHARTEPVARLTAGEHEVLALMAEGWSDAAIAQRLFTTEKAVSMHAAGIFAKLELTPSDDDNRRLLAVLAYLES